MGYDGVEVVLERYRGTFLALCWCVSEREDEKRMHLARRGGNGWHLEGRTGYWDIGIYEYWSSGVEFLKGHLVMALFLIFFGFGFWLFEIPWEERVSSIWHDDMI